jgi:bifunctional non-homologous end joining protein LigD
MKRHVIGRTAQRGKRGSMQPASISLYLREGSSDKEYHAALEPSGGGYVVTFRYGRRGEALKSGTKTASPVSYADAKATYDKLVAEKVKKGYSPGADGAAYQATPLESRFAGVLPQLLNPIDDAMLDALLGDSRYVLQEKYDGKRVMIRRTPTGVEGANRRGLVIALPAAVAGAAERIAGTYLVDGELVGEAFYAFDALERDGHDLRGFGYETRYESLCALFAGAEPPLWLATCHEDKRAALARVRAARGEGVVFKDRLAPYSAGRPASGGPQLKYKLVASATFRVSGANGTKRSVALEVQERGQWVAIGNVTIPVNQPVPVAGALVEVQYLYAFRGGSLFQPVFLGVRDDVDEEAAKADQLKYKADADADEAA